MIDNTPQPHECEKSTQTKVHEEVISPEEVTDDTLNPADGDATADESTIQPDEGSILSFDMLDVNKWQDRIARLLVILALCAQPLFVTPSNFPTFYMDLTANKFAFFSIFMCIILLAIAIIWASRMLRKPRLLPKGMLSPADWAILGFAAVTLLSALFSPYKDAANLWIGRPDRHDGAITQLLYVTIYFIVSRWYKPRKSDFVLLGISAAIITMIGIFQSFGMDILDYLFNERGGPDITVHDVLTTLTNTNFVGTYSVLVSLLFGFMYVKSSARLKYVWLTSGAFGFWLMLLSNADSARIGMLAALVFGIIFIIENRQVFGRFLILGSSWIAVYLLQTLLSVVINRSPGSLASLFPYIIVFATLVTAGLFFVRYRRKICAATPFDTNITDNSDHNLETAEVNLEHSAYHSGLSTTIRYRWKLGLILIASTIIIGLIAIEILGRNTDIGMVYEAREIMHGRIHDDFATNRIYVWRNGLQLVLHNPVIGSGPDTFPYAFTDDMHVTAIERYRTFFDKAHNEYLQILVCQGILGLLSYMVFLAWIFMKSVPIAIKNPIVMAILVAVFGYLAQAFFNISLPIASQMLWVFTGMLMNERIRKLEWATRSEVTQESVNTTHTEYNPGLEIQCTQAQKTHE